MPDEVFKEYSPAFQKACAMLREEPFPMDWEKRLNALRKKIPKHERADFGWFYEGFMARAPKEYFEDLMKAP